MNQVILGLNKPYANNTAVSTNLTTLQDGQLAFFSLKDGSLITKSGKAESNFSIALGAPSGKMPFSFPEVDVKSLNVVKATGTQNVLFTASIIIPTTVVGKNYTIVVAKKGVVFNERNKWTFTVQAKTTTAADVANALKTSINNNTSSSGLTASVSSNSLTISTLEIGADFNVICADELSGVKPTITSAKEAILDKTFVQEFIKKHIANKGVVYTHQEGLDIYPNYDADVADTTYVMYTLRFAVGRAASKQVDDVVFQNVYIIVPSAAACIADIDVILGLTDPVQSQSEE